MALLLVSAQVGAVAVMVGGSALLMEAPAQAVSAPVTPVADRPDGDDDCLDVLAPLVALPF